MTTSTRQDRPDNDIFLRGRLAADPIVRVLPSGDELLGFRLTVDRADDGRSAGKSGSGNTTDRRRVRVDSIDCATVLSRVRRSVERATPGDELELAGELHRRFWRSPQGQTSRYEVLVTSARIIRRRRTDA